MPHMRSSWGTINKVAKGVYRIRYLADEHDGKGYVRRSKTVRGTRKQAEEQRALLHVNHGNDHPAPTIQEAFDLWYYPDLSSRLNAYLNDPTPGSKTEKIKSGSYQVLMSAWNRFVKPAWGDKYITDIHYADVQTWLDGLNDSAARKSMTILKSIGRYCVMNESVDKNIFMFEYRLPSKSEKRDDSVWSLFELNEKLWPAIHGRICEPAFLMCAFDSCRVGESLSPKLSEIEQIKVNGMTLVYIPIKRQVRNKGGLSADTDLKTKLSMRPTVVPEPWSLRLLQLKEQGEHSGNIWLSDNSLGEPISQHVLRGDFKRALNEAGIPYKEMRALRRSWRTWISTYGISEEIMEKMMGHVGTGVTAKHYLKVDYSIIADEIYRAFVAKPVNVSWDYLGLNK